MTFLFLFNILFFLFFLASFQIIYLLIVNLFAISLFEMFFRMEIILIWMLINFIVKGDLIIDILVMINNFRLTDKIRDQLFFNLIYSCDFSDLRILGFEWMRSLLIRFLIFHFTKSKVIDIFLLLVNWMTFVSTSKSYPIRIITLNKKFNYWVIRLWIIFSIFCAVGLMENISKLYFVIL